jgi:UDP-N-acetylenolpyruvoylglucosamine reductase
MGLAPLAAYLAQTGFQVTGEDDAPLDREVAALLERERVGVGPLPAGCELLVHSSAVSADHPACAAARRRGLPIVRRGEMLAEVVRDRKLVAVCGSHGKTTTTAMLITALRRANFPAGFVLGGLFGDGTSPARVGSNDWVVAEVDESDGTIDRFSPEIAVVVNLDWDHPDRYRDPEEFDGAFASLLARTRGAVLLSDACARSLRRLAALGAGPRSYTFGRSGDFSGEQGGKSRDGMSLRLGGLFPGIEVSIRASGDFNAANATAAFAAAQLMGLQPSPELLSGFAGVRRRQQMLEAPAGLSVLEDYAHHPTEIRALLTSLRRRGAGRLVVVFQPHRFSRTAQFKSEFAAALALCDSLHLLDVYPAGESPVAGGTAADIYAEIKKGGASMPVSYLPGGDREFFRALSRDARPGDLIAFVGAGDIDRKARAWIEERKGEDARARRWDEFAAAALRLLGPGSVLRREEPIGPRTTLRVGGSARVYVEPATLEDLRSVLRLAAERGAAVFILGRGSNLIVPDEGVEGVVLSLAGEAWSAFEARPDGRVWAGAGLRLKNLCGLAARAGLAGFEFLEGIPGSVGGALRMNAGAMGGWMFDVVEELQIASYAGEVRTLRRNELHVDYRCCAEVGEGIALGALLRPAAKAESDAIGRRVDAYRRRRHETQPREPSAGCIFKNPPGRSAGRLIDESGLKGERVGDAEVSAVHANFIVNRGAATGSDVLELVRRVRARVRQATGVDLEPEVLLYGKEWKDVL